MWGAIATAVGAITAPILDSTLPGDVNTGDVYGQFDTSEEDAARKQRETLTVVFVILGLLIILTVGAVVLKKYLK